MRIGSEVKTKRVGTALAVGCALAGLSWCREGFAVTAQVHGQAGLVGSYWSSLLPDRQTYQGWRAPLGLTLEARPSNSLSLFVDLRIGFNEYPELARSLGNPQDMSGATFNSPPLATVGGRGERSDPVIGTLAFAEYASEFGLFRVGRMPKHWGLGIWRNDGGRGPSPEGRWLVEGGTGTVIDAIEYSVDFRDNLLFTAAWEKSWEGDPTSRSDDGDAWTLELVVSNESPETPSSGLRRSVGIAYSRYADPDTKLNTVDLASTMSFDAIELEGEILYVDGTSTSNAYDALGGPASCQNPGTAAADCTEFTKRGVDNLALLTRVRYWLSDRAANATAAIGQLRTVPTALRPNTQSVGLTLGVVTGDNGAFETQPSGRTDNDVTGGAMHPNIRPALLMFGAPVAEAPGMPGAIVRNAWFARGDYRFEAPDLGTITPSVIWGRLQQRRGDGAQEGYGRYEDLGLEVDATYEYTTRDQLSLGVQAGIWFPGAAWAQTGSERPDVAYGFQVMAGTSF